MYATIRWHAALERVKLSPLASLVFSLSISVFTSIKGVSGVGAEAALKVEEIVADEVEVHVGTLLQAN